MKTNASAWSVFLIFLKLGLTSFGGPIAHLGYFREEFVVKRQWVSEQAYADWVALCQFLPGPASSQIGIILGLNQAGYLGAVMAWLGFTLPSALFLILCALSLSNDTYALPDAVLHGFKIAAVAIVTQAVWGMASKLCRTVPTVSIMLIAAGLVLWFPVVWLPVAVMVLMGMAGAALFSPAQVAQVDLTEASPIKKRTGAIWLLLFMLGLLGLPMLATLFPHQHLAVIDAFYRSGSLVFGGGHVVLPLLQAETVATHWIGNDVFLAGYGLAQMVPGPLFTFAAFLGASITDMGNAWLGGLTALLAIFIPSFLLVFGVLPFWKQLRRYRRIQGALVAVNAAVVGILLAALYQPVWTSAIAHSKDFSLALIAFVALVFWRLPSWLVVPATGLLAWLITFL